MIQKSLMGRVYDKVVVNGVKLHTLFDSGAISNYITSKAVQKAEIKTNPLSNGFKTGLGGKVRGIKEHCLISAKIKRYIISFRAFVVDKFGKDEHGNELDLIIGATEMQHWNIQLDLKSEKLDLSRFRKEFVEF